MLFTKSLRYYYEFIDSVGRTVRTGKFLSPDQAIATSNGNIAVCKRTAEITVAHQIPKDAVHLKIQSEYAEDLTHAELTCLLEWTDQQENHLLRNLPLQHILTLYHVSSKHPSLRAWLDSDISTTYQRYNVIMSGNEEKPYLKINLGD